MYITSIYGRKRAKIVHQFFSQIIGTTMDYNFVPYSLWKAHLKVRNEMGFKPFFDAEKNEQVSTPYF